MTYLTSDIVVQEDTPFGAHLNRSAIHGPMPVLEWGPGLKVIVSSIHPHKADVLRDWAHQLLALAAEVDARQNTRPPSGYDAPIPYVLPTDAEDRAAAEMHS